MTLSQIDGAYSPDVSGELTIHGLQFVLSSIGSKTISVRNPAVALPGQGTVRLTIDQDVTVYHVELPEGIDPLRETQPCRVLGIVAGAAA
jgi:hypothetical protein